MNKIKVSDSIRNTPPKVISGRLYQYIKENGMYDRHVYLAVRQGDGTRLYSLIDGCVWSSVSAFGSQGDRFIILPEGTQVTITVQE